MSAPMKPWEVGLNRSSVASPMLQSSTNWDRPMPVGMPSMTSVPPPLPARRPNPNSYYPTSQSYMSPYRYGGYNSYMGYSPYGYSPYGQRMMGMPYDYDSRMMQVAEESCQALFGPLDSFVRSVSSVAMVLDSTMQAMQMSFRTVVSAADSLSRLKSMAVEVASGISVFSVIANFFRRLFRMLGLIRGTSGPAEKEWAAAAAKAAGAAAVKAGAKGPSAWPAMAFFAIMMGGPYLMFRMFSQLPPPTQDNIQGWIPSAGDSERVTALFDFDASGPGELSVKKGDRLLMRVGSASNGWVLVSDGTQSGYAPTNRLVKHAKPRQNNFAQRPPQRSLVEEPSVMAPQDSYPVPAVQQESYLPEPSQAQEAQSAPAIQSECSDSEALPLLSAQPELSETPLVLEPSCQPEV